MYSTADDLPQGPSAAVRSLPPSLAAHSTSTFAPFAHLHRLQPRVTHQGRRLPRQRRRRFYCALRGTFLLLLRRKLLLLALLV
ncbi:hypothetical protein PsYK624_148730 [Phanerochaete sordida]|uniref:Uncharacterized protein n=1 Tax=Phanerochaete sordida TaxID=48140 RepID=A0A9P3LKJ2_9APHY|nr:hypothetical protein PsYK624_148730 [Phanerochaete sordida]